MTFDRLKYLFIERWGTKQEREQLRATIDHSHEKKPEGQECDHEYLHQQSMPKRRAELVVHHDEDSPTQIEAHAPAGGEIIVTIIDEKRRAGNDRQKGQKRNRGQWERVGNHRSAKTKLTAVSVPKSPSNIPEPPRSLSQSPALSPQQPTNEGVGLWDTNEPKWNTQDVGWGVGPTQQDIEEVSLDLDSGGGVNGWDTGEEGGIGSGQWNDGADWERKPEGTGEDEWKVNASNEHSCQESLEQGSSPIEDWGAGDNTNSTTAEETQQAQNSDPEPLEQVCDMTAPCADEKPDSPSVRRRLLEGKIAAITGASRGIGRAIALGFAREGAHILAHYWGTDSAPADDDIVSLSMEIRGMGQQCVVTSGDISDPETSYNIVQKALEAFGRIDIGVGNAGMCTFSDLWDITPELMLRHADVNINGNLWFVQACARQMKAQYLTATRAALDGDHWNEGELSGDMPDHSLLLISSTTSMTASPAAAHYAASSAAIVSLVQSMAVDLGKYGIRCNALLPGTVMTRMVKEGVVDLEMSRGLERRAPLLGKRGRPRDMVGPAIFLAGEQSRFVTGTKLVVDGGVSAGGGGGW